jgi:hypothetical protein
MSNKELVKSLNLQYRMGRPSNSAAEAGVVWRSFDSWFAWGEIKYPSSGYQLNETADFAKKLFGATRKDQEKQTLPASIINLNISSNKHGVALFRAWNNSVDVFGPASGIVFSSCAVDRALRCSYLTDGASDERTNAGCGRSYLHKVRSEDADACRLDGLMFLSANENVATHRDMTLSVNGSDPTGPTASGAEAELLFNRKNPLAGVNICEGKTKDELNQRIVEQDMREEYSDLPGLRSNLTKGCRDFLDRYSWPSDVLFKGSPPFFESPGYYGTLGEANRTRPRPQLKQMLRWQSLLATSTWSATLGFTPDRFNEWIYNELVIDAATIDGVIKGDDDRCKGGIAALVCVCGEHDHFFVDEVGRCMHVTFMFELAYPGVAVPPLIWIDLKNSSAPFGTSCDKPDVCGSGKNHSRIDEG